MEIRDSGPRFPLRSVPLFGYGSLADQENREFVWETLSGLLRIFLIVAFAVLGIKAALASPPVTGNWLVASRDAVIQIAPCGASLCGRIVGTVIDPPGGPMPTNWLHQPQCHETIVQISPPAARGDVWAGSVQDPRNGSTYHARAWRDGENLKLRGYLGLPIFGRTQIWTAYRGVVPADCRLAPGR